MSRNFPIGLVALVGLTFLPVEGLHLVPAAAFAQENSAAAAAAESTDDNQPLDEDELAVLVARIALYPDELVALISSASLYPLQVVEAQRFIETNGKDKAAKPKSSWDGSIISLLNYPEIVKMMNDDLEWTQALGDALVNQQQDVLVAIQQLRSEAVANGVVKTDDKITVTQSNDNIVIAPARAEAIYVPQYAPEMLYEPGYSAQPVGYYPSSYPNYAYPSAPYFAAAVTGLAFAAVVDWDDWGVWGGHWGGGDIDIDCDHCLNNVDISGKMKLSDIDWKNVDRDKIKFDHNQFANINRNSIKDRIKVNGDNSFKVKADGLRDRGLGSRGDRPKVSVTDIRSSKIGRGDRGDMAMRRPSGNRPPGIGNGAGKAGLPVPGKRPDIRPHPAISHAAAAKPDFKRPAGKPRPGGLADARPKRPSAIGHIDSGRRAQLQSSRGHKAMGGGHHGGGGHRAIKRGGGRHHR